MTGESTPVEVSPGMKVIGSALNNNGRLIVRATRVGSDTELARITSMVVTAQGNKAPIQAYADKIASFFVPLVTLLAIATFAFWFYLDNQSLTFAISTAITVLVIACPCALGLATPVALLVATGRGALRGIVIRQPRVLEASRRIDVAIFDKTGTLTDGVMRVSLDLDKPIGFGVLTVDTIEQAIARSGVAGSKEDKGHDSAVAALDLLRVKRELGEKFSN